MSKIQMEDIGNILSAYAEHHILPKATGAQKFFTAIAIAALADQSKKLAEAYKPMLEMIGVAADNFIDITKLHDYAHKAFAKTGKFQYMGIIFGPDDVDAIMDIAERYVQ